MEPTTLFIAYGPDARTDDFIRAAKDRVRKAVGDRLYLSDPPHATVYLAAFDDPAGVVETIEDLFCTAPAIPGEFEGWHVFENDPLTGGNTPTCRIDSRCRDRLRSIQPTIVDNLYLQRNPEASEARYRTHWEKLTTLRRQTVREIGFPYFREDWIPHFSIASIGPEAWDDGWAVLKETPPLGPFSCDWLRIYRLDGIEPVLFHEIRLQTGP